MQEKINAIIAGFRTRGHTALFPVLLSNDGKVLENTFSPAMVPSSHHITTYIRLFTQHCFIQDLFVIDDFQKAALLTNDAATPQPGFPLKRAFLNYFVDYHSYSLMPDHYCIIKRVSPENLLALIYSNVHTPQIDNFEEPILFFNETNELHAFNFPFFTLLSGFYSDPRDLLGQPMASLFVETPRDLENTITQKLLESINQSKSPDFSPSALAADRFEPSAPADCISEDSHGFSMHNRSDDTELLTLNSELNLFSEAVQFDMEYRSNNGLPPVFMFGHKGYSEKNFLTPDQAGFSFGPDAEGTRLVMKRTGYLLCSRPFKAPEPDAVHSLSLMAGKHFLFCFINRQTVFAYYNFNDFLIHRQYLNIGIRPGQTLRLSAMGMAAFRLDRDLDEEVKNSVLRFKYFPDRYFSISSFANPILRHSTLPLRGVILHEITALQKKIEYQERRSRQLQAQLDQAKQLQNRFIGSSSAVQRILEYAQVVAKTNIPVLLQGPTGSGKGILASFVHESSPVAGKPFVKMDCSTIPHELFESIVFGHVKGAFTGAHTDSTGLLEKANTGTVFIDEIQNLTPVDQAKLLHVLQEYTITKVGGNKSTRLNIRFVIATNQDLEKLILQGKFRQDLFYRINTVTIFLPPLKEHKEDIPELCAHFIAQFNRETGKMVETLDRDCYPILYQYDWPGNIRELKNVITHACLFTTGSLITPEVIRQNIYKTPISPIGPAAEPDGGGDYVGRISRGQFVELLRKHKGKVVSVAKEMGITRNTVYYNARRFNINLDEYQQS